VTDEVAIDTARITFHLISHFVTASPQGEASFPLNAFPSRASLFSPKCLPLKLEPFSPPLPSPGGEGGPLAVDEVAIDTASLTFHLISHFVTASPQGEAFFYPKCFHLTGSLFPPKRLPLEGKVAAQPSDEVAPHQAGAL